MSKKIMSNSDNNINMKINSNITNNSNIKISSSCNNNINITTTTNNNNNNNINITTTITNNNNNNINITTTTNNKKKFLLRQCCHKMIDIAAKGTERKMFFFPKNFENKFRLHKDKKNKKEMISSSKVIIDDLQTKPFAISFTPYYKSSVMFAHITLGKRFLFRPSLKNMLKPSCHISIK